MSPCQVLKNCTAFHRKTLQGFDEKRNVEGLKQFFIKFGVQTSVDRPTKMPSSLANSLDFHGGGAGADTYYYYDAYGSDENDTTKNRFLFDTTDWKDFDLYNSLEIHGFLPHPFVPSDEYTMSTQRSIQRQRWRQHHCNLQRPRSPGRDHSIRSSTLAGTDLGRGCDCSREKSCLEAAEQSLETNKSTGRRRFWKMILDSC